MRYKLLARHIDLDKVPWSLRPQAPQISQSFAARDSIRHLIRRTTECHVEQTKYAATITAP